MSESLSELRYVPLLGETETNTFKFCVNNNISDLKEYISNKFKIPSKNLVIFSSNKCIFNGQILLNTLNLSTDLQFYEQNKFELGQNSRSLPSTSKLCSITKNENNVIIKKYVIDGKNDDEKYKSLIPDIICYSKLQDHENVVKLVGVFTEISTQGNLIFYIGLENMGKCLEDILDPNDPFDERRALEIVKDVLKVLSVMHSMKLIHRSIRSRSIFILNHQVKVGNFEFAKFLEGYSEEQLSKGLMLSRQQEPINWMAPELISDNPRYDFKVDIWSTGLLLVSLITGKAPYTELDEMEMIHCIRNNRPPKPASTTNRVTAILNCCFKHNPNERPTADQLLELF